jgi:hypothetical protein
MEKWKIFTLPEFDPSVVQPVVCRYTDCAAAYEEEEEERQAKLSL